MANRYWVANSGTRAWDPSNTANWSTSSGGGGGASVPTSSDAVFFNSSSGTGTVYVNPGAVCASLSIASNLSLDVIAGGEITVHGNVSVNSAKDFDGFRVSFAASGTLTSNGKTIYGFSVKNGATVTAADAVTAAGVISIEDGGNVVLPAGETSSTYAFDPPNSGSSSLKSSTGGVQAAFNAEADCTLEYITVQDIAFGGNANWTTGTGYTDGGNNTIPSPVTSIVPVLFAQSLA